MKKIVFILSMIFIMGQANACDICGCGVGSNYIGILPEFNRHIMGIRYRYNALQTHIGSGGAITYLTTKEVYRTAELWGGWNLGKNFRVMASIPYSFNERVNQGNTNSKNGIGDVSVSGYYQLVNNKHPVGASKLLVQSLWIGAGVKLPTGKYNPADKTSLTQNTNLFQLGTASTDFTLNTMYDIRLQDAGINVAASYKLNTTNKYDYAYGNKASINAQAYYKCRINNKVMIAPNAGVLYENSKKDVDGEIPVDISGGNVLSGTAGLEVSFRKITLGGNFQKPLSQDLARGIVKSGNRAMIHLSFLL